MLGSVPIFAFQNIEVESLIPSDQISQVANDDNILNVPL